MRTNAPRATTIKVLAPVISLAAFVGMSGCAAEDAQPSSEPTVSEQPASPSGDDAGETSTPSSEAAPSEASPVEEVSSADVEPSEPAPSESAQASEGAAGSVGSCDEIPPIEEVELNNWGSIYCDGHWMVYGMPNSGTILYARWNGSEWETLGPDGPSDVADGCYDDDKYRDMGAPPEFTGRLQACDPDEQWQAEREPFERQR